MKPSIHLSLAAALIVMSLSQSCQNHTKVPEAKSTPSLGLAFNILEEHRISLPFDFNVAVNLTVQAYTRNDTDFILMGDIEGSRLVEIDISHYRFSRAIALDKIAAGRYPVYAHHYLNPDSIVIFGGISNEYSLCADSVLYAINLKGETQGIYELQNSPYRLRGMSRKAPQASFYHHFMPMEVAQHRFFVNPLPLFATHKKREEGDTGVHEIGYFDFKADAQLPYRGIPYYRDIDPTLMFADEQEKTYLHAIDSSEILVGHANSPELRKVSVSKGTYSASHEKGRFIPDPIPAESASQRQPAKNPKSTLFGPILYDPDQDLAFRFAGLGTDLPIKPGDLYNFRDSIVWVGAYDKDLNLMAQALKPKHFAHRPKPAYFKGKFVGVRPTDHPREFLLQYSRLETQVLSSAQNDSLADLFKKAKPHMSQENINTLFKKYQIPEQSIILSVSNRACPYCVEHSIAYYLKHQKQMEKDQVYLVVSESSASAELLNTRSSYIIVDTKKQLENLLQQSIDNPALMLWNGKKVTQTMVLPPQEVDQIELYLGAFKDLRK